MFDLRDTPSMNTDATGHFAQFTYTMEDILIAVKIRFTLCTTLLQLNSVDRVRGEEPLFLVWRKI